MQDGRALEREEAVELGRQLPDVVLETDLEEVEKQSATFKVCFRNIVDLFAREDASGPVPLTQLDYLQENRQQRAIPGQMYSYRAPNGTTGSGFVDASGCTVSLTRQTGSWAFQVYLYTWQANPGRGVFYMSNAGALNYKTENISVTSISISIARDVQAAAAFRPFQAAILLSHHTLTRANQIGAVGAGNNALRISPSPSGEAFYCHTGQEGSCTSQRTMRVPTNRANERGTIAHETGHWIHKTNLEVAAYPNYNYEAPASAPDDDCLRGPGHTGQSVEYQSAAHHEGLADLFNAVAYNDLNGEDCQLPFYIGAGVEVALDDCEAPGKALEVEGCYEWNDSAAFAVVGNELDWTKMYWDYVTDKGGLMSTYMAAEGNVPSWSGTGAHYSAIIAQMSSTERNRLNSAAAGNIWGGTPDL